MLGRRKDIVSVNIQCQASIYTLSLSREFMAGAASQAGDVDSSWALVSPLVCRGPWMFPVVLYFWCHSDIASVLWYFNVEVNMLLDETSVFFRCVVKLLTFFCTPIYLWKAFLFMWLKKKPRMPLLPINSSDVFPDFNVFSCSLSLKVDKQQNRHRILMNSLPLLLIVVIALFWYS